MLTDESYQQQINSILTCGGGNFYMVRAEHCRFLKGDGAPILVLSFLLNLMRMKNSNPTDRLQLQKEEMWFKCPAKFIQEELGMYDQKQQRAISVLEEYKLIEKQHRVGHCLWIRIRVEELEKASKNPPSQPTSEVKTTFLKSENHLPNGEVETTFSEKLKPLDRKVETTFSEKLKPLDRKVETTDPYTTNKPTNKTSIKTPVPPLEFCRSWLVQLKEIIHSAKPPRRVSDAKGQVEELQKLWMDWGGDEEAKTRVNNLLQMYSLHINEIQQPIIHGAKDLRARSDWLWNEIQKQHKRNSIPISSSHMEENGDGTFSFKPAKVTDTSRLPIN